MKLTDLNGLSNKRLKALDKNGVQTVLDLLYLFPRRYIDKTVLRPIRFLSTGTENVTVVGKVTDITLQGFKNRQRLEVIIQDDTGSVKGVWFRGIQYFRKTFESGQSVAFYGNPKLYGSQFSFAHPDVEHLGNNKDVSDLKKVVPVYPGNKDFSKSFITSKLISQWIEQIISQINIREFIPDRILSEMNFPHREKALRKVHFPESKKDVQIAIDRFKFEELFLFELSMAKIKEKNKSLHDGFKFKSSGNLTTAFFKQNLPFKLTGDQKKVLREIYDDLGSGNQMARLIQGDVGSGKTVVAAGAMLLGVDNGYQAAFMAPTEILAEQHYQTLNTFFEGLDVNTHLITGSLSASQKKEILKKISEGECDILVGTHAVIQQGVRFRKLGLAVIDEQHRFGVKQRSEILRKGDHPHLLVMSATPIPRSLAMTIYSDLDISLIKELPEGRKPVKTAVRTERKRNDLYAFIKQNIREGGQAYFIYPLIEESEVMDLKDATIGFEKLKRHFPEFKIGLMHGRLKNDEKEKTMQRFKEGGIDILVSTTVIEVGVDVPNANVMVIEHAERFGLSQLHQLRGRIGRGSRESYCILMPGEKISKEGRYRLKKLTETNDGFEIAEADLKLRGPGDFLGTKQSGLPEFKIADIIEDQRLLVHAKHFAWKLIHNDPDLHSHPDLKKVFDPYFEKKSELLESA